VYVMVWGVIFMLSAILALLITALMGSPQLMTAAFLPMALMVAGMFFTSMLFSVRDCFSTDVDDEQSAPPPSAD
jgi:hypothetical protein